MKLPLCAALLILFPISHALAQAKDVLYPIDVAIRQAIDARQLPGAVVLILKHDQVVYRRSFGLRKKEPNPETMTADTVFDLASLTKPIATATSIWILIEEGKLRLSDRVAQHLPEFGAHGKEKVTVEQLMTHTSGLVADNPEADYRDGRAKALERIYGLALVTPPGSKFTYSDVGYIVLGELVERLSGLPLDRFAQDRIFKPLGMKETTFRPDGEFKARSAPTQMREGRWMRGEVHDPRSYALGGVAGHAGLFSTADDLAIYARMIRAGGTLNGQRILGPESVRAMTQPRAVPGGLRSCGWDVDSAFSSNRGKLFSRAAGFGHTGFTGTSIWFDPPSETVVIFLSNRVHPDGKSNINRLRGQIATLAAAALAERPPQVPAGVLTGIDVLERENFQRLRGRHVGLVTNHTGRDREGRSTIDLLHEAKDVTLVALFSPEHGIRGLLDEKVTDTRDTKTGLPIYSLYGTRRRPTAETLQGIDTLIFDIQDVGCRFYTYITTLGYILEAARENHLLVTVLDRPNPLGGLAVDGPVLDRGRESFVGYYPLPVRHGMTVGELARLFNDQHKKGADLDVVTMRGWQRGMLFDESKLHWIPPSPNLRTLTAALLYPGIGLLETTNLSVGRGTERPFEWIGAPWLDGQRLATALGEEKIPGVRFVPMQLTPSTSVFKGTACDGVQIIVDNWSRFEPVRTGLAVACTLHRLYGDTWTIDRFDDLLRNHATWEAVKRGTSWRELEREWAPALKEFKAVREKYLLYGEY